MTETDKLTRLKTELNITDANDDIVLQEYLDDAQDAILNRLYPFSRPDGAVVPANYERVQIALAKRMYLREGAEGEILHNENGVHRHYGSANDEDLLSEVIPFAMVR